MLPIPGIVNLSGRGMLIVSVARQLGWGTPLRAYYAYYAAPLKPSGAGKRCPGSAKLTMPPQVIVPEFVSELGPALQLFVPLGLRVVDPSAAIVAQGVGELIDLSCGL
jgi:hypothetical protein